MDAACHQGSESPAGGVSDVTHAFPHAGRWPKPMITHRVHLSAPVRLVGVAILLLVLSVYGSVVLGRSQPTATQVPSFDAASAWPDGVDLLAAQAISLPAGDYQWQITNLTALPDSGEPFEVHEGVLIAASGAVLVQINDVDTIRLNNGAALPVHEGDRVVATS